MVMSTDLGTSFEEGLGKNIGPNGARPSRICKYYVFGYV
jgi:hypothetical protein